MGDGDSRSLPSALKFRALACFKLSRLIPFGLIFSFLAIIGCNGQSKLLLAQAEGDLQNVQSQESSDYSCSYFYFMWGRSAELEEQFEEAREAYEKALICDPKREYLEQRLVGVLIKMGEETQALARLQGMISGDDEQKDIDKLFMLARLYAQMDKYQEAEKTCNRILDIDPENQNALLFLGTLHARNGNFEEGREVLEELVEINRQSFIGYSYLARLYRELDLQDEATAAYKKALEINWSKNLAWEALKYYEDEGLYEEAIAIYKDFLAEDSANLKLRGHLIKLYLRMNKVDEAMNALQEMRAYMVDTFQLDITIGRFLLELQKFEEAVTYFEKMLEEDRQTDVIRGFLALAYHGSGDEEKAKEVLKEIPESSEAYEDAVIMLMQIYQEEEKFDEAVNLLKKAIAGEESRRPSFYSILAELYHEQGNNETGLEIYEEGIRIYPENVEMRYNLAIFLDRMGRMANALKRMEEVLEIAPEDPQALNYVGYTWADQGRNLDQALAYIQKAASAEPESGYIRDSLGWVYYKRGEFERAVVELEKAIELEPEDATINEHLGDAYIKVNKFKKAAAAYKKAHQLYDKEEKVEIVKRKLKELGVD